MHTSSPRALRVLGASLCLLAWWLQLLGPALALRMAAIEADPLARPILCGQTVGTGRTDSATQAPAPSGLGCGHCDLCAGPPTTPVVAEPFRALRVLRWQRITWTLLPQDAVPARPKRTGLPRAPPAFA